MTSSLSTYVIPVLLTKTQVQTSVDYHLFHDVCYH